jgi:hypothetical protein
MSVNNEQQDLNETTVSAATEAIGEEFSLFADLPLSSEQLEEINGGQIAGHTIRLRIATTNNQGKL